MENNIAESIRPFFQYITDKLSLVMFHEILGFPLIVIWLIAGGLFFTLRLGFVNITMFRHGISAAFGKYDNPNDPGQISHFQALCSAVSATVGLGNIAGVAIAITIGGPGAIIWMMIAGFMGMSLKFAEVTLGQKYRTIDADGKVSGGAFNYLEKGLADLNYAKLGKFLAVFFAFACIGASFGSGNLFQANQSVSILLDTFAGFEEIKTAVAIALAAFVGAIIIGGIKRIGAFAAKVVPFMAIIYILACLVVLFTHASAIPAAVMTMFSSAFGLEAAAGGIIGAIVAGFQRATFSNEAGIGSAPIAHSAAKTKEPVREGCVALLEPFLDTIIICFMTGIVITVTGVYINPEANVDGVILTSRAFSTVIWWFPYVLSVCVLLFALSTMITWAYYGEIAWQYLFGRKLLHVYHLAFVLVTFAGGVMSDIMLIVDFADLLLFMMAIPNLIALYMLSPLIRRELAAYRKKLDAGKFDKKKIITK